MHGYQETADRKQCSIFFIMLLPANSSSEKYRTTLYNPRTEQPSARVQQQVSHEVHQGSARAAGTTSYINLMPGTEKIPPFLSYIIIYNTPQKVNKNKIQNILNSSGQNLMQGKILTHPMTAGSHDIYVTNDDLNSPLHGDFLVSALV